MTEKFNSIVNKILKETEGEVESNNFWNNFEYNTLLSEGLITSYDVKFLVPTLKKIKGITEISSEGSELMSKANPIKIKFNSNLDTKKFRETLKVYGYDIARQSPGIVVVEAKFPIELNKEYWPPEFYHVAPNGLIPKIQKNGLVTKASNRKEFRYEQSRIYLFYSKNPQYIKRKLSYVLWNSSTQDKSPEEVNRFKKYRANSPNDYTLIKIHSTDLEYHKLYVDPQFNQKDILSVFTLRNIHPSSLII